MYLLQRIFFNLVGKNAIESCHFVAELFNLLQIMHTWLVASSHRWQEHQKFLNALPTWYSIPDVLYSKNMQTFDKLASDDIQPHGSRIEAERYLKKLKLLKTSILLETWNAILNRFHKKNLPCKKTD